jgi:hypothetical protein
MRLSSKSAHGSTASHVPISDWSMLIRPRRSVSRNSPSAVARWPGGRQRTVDVREVLNGIFYILATGCQWRALPKDLPPRSTVYDYLIPAVGSSDGRSAPHATAVWAGSICQELARPV